MRTYLHGAVDALNTLPAGFDLELSNPSALADRARALKGEAQGAHERVTDVLNAIEGLLEQGEADNRADPPQPAEDPIPLKRAAMQRWQQELAKAEKALDELVEGGIAEDDLTALAAALDELPEVTAEVATEHQGLREMREGISDLICWALDAGAEPADLPVDCSLRDLVRQADLLRVRGPVPALRAAAQRCAEAQERAAAPTKRGPGYLRPMSLDEELPCEGCRSGRELRVLAVYEDRDGYDTVLCPECGAENTPPCDVEHAVPPCRDPHCWLRETGQGVSASGDLPGTATVLMGGKHVAGPAPTVPPPLQEQAEPAPEAPKAATGTAPLPPSTRKTRARKARKAESATQDSNVLEKPVNVSLAAFSQTLRPYQEALVTDALAFVEQVEGMDPTAPEATRRRLYSMPTGTGKGTAQLALLQKLRADGLDAWIYTPSLEVLRGYLERCGAEGLQGCSEDRLAELGEAIWVTTPVRAQRRILEGLRTAPQVVLYDEVHHATEGNDVSGTLFALAPLAAWIGFTATPYRGSPKGTLELEEAWPDMVEVLSVPEAVANGSWALPTFSVVPLVDDDAIKIEAGDFQGKAAGNAVGSRIEDLAKLVLERGERDKDESGRFSAGGGDYQPTAVTVPNRETAGLLVEALDRLGVAARLVSADTPASARALAYAECRDGRAVLVSVRVLAEGVDFPWLVRLVDARPTLSPVSWLQQVGRITRPKSRRPEYICVCRNLERHAYLLQGMVPRKVIGDAQAVFDGPSKRGAGRAMGLEALTRFKQIDLPLADGVRGHMYCLYSVDGDTGITTEWAVLLDPTSERAVSATRQVQALPDGTRGYGKWQAATVPAEMAGFATSGFKGAVSEKQAAWWRRAAVRHGLDPNAVGKLTKRQFAALPVLSDLRLNLRAEQVAGEAQ